VEESTFSWSVAFAHLHEIGVGEFMFEKFFDARSHVDLINTALTCKTFYGIMKSSAVLTWRLRLPGQHDFVQLLDLEDSSPQARTMTASMLDIRKDLFVKFRKILFDWLVDVQHEYQLSTETLHLAFNLIDRCFQHTSDLPTDKIQLLGASCLFIAAKMNETTHPSTTEMAWVCDNAFSNDEFRSMEMRVLFDQQFKVRSVTPCEFIGGLCLVLQLPAAIKSAASYLADLFMLEHESIGVAPSSIAGACIILALHHFHSASAPKVTFKDVAFLARTPAYEIRDLVCKIQRFYLIDYFTNGKGKEDGSVVRPVGDWRGPAMQAVNRRHSMEDATSAKIPPGLRNSPPALAAPQRIKLLLTGCCGWCQGAACARAQECGRAFPQFVDYVHVSKSPSAAFE